MDLRKTLLKAHSKENTSKIVDYLIVNPDTLNELINIYILGPSRLTQRAAWPLSYYAEKAPTQIKPHLKTLISFMKKSDQVAVKRNTLRLLQFVDIPKPLHTTVINLGFQFLQDKKESIAVKVFSMTVLAKLIIDEPDLKRELYLVIEDQIPYSGPAFKSRARRVLKALGSKMS